jgi:hypothetical protein
LLGHNRQRQIKIIRSVPNRTCIHYYTYKILHRPKNGSKALIVQIIHPITVNY